jgi:ferric-dicitrate binding protein FerR (iron transport regulator)
MSAAYRAARRWLQDVPMMAHRAPAPIPADDWRRDIALVIGAAVFLIALALIAQWLNPVPA